MSKLDAHKRADWQNRLERFEISGLTVAQFCQKEKTAPHTFYYWKKRLGRPANDKRHSLSGRAIRKGCGEVSTDKVPTVSETAPSSAPLIHFTWDNKFRVSIPATCLGAIRCVLEHATRDPDEPRGPVSAFRQVHLAE